VKFFYFGLTHISTGNVLEFFSSQTVATVWEEKNSRTFQGP